MYQPGEDMPMSPGYPGGAFYPPANMYMPYGPAGMGYMGPPPHGMMMPPPGYEHPGQQQQGGYPQQQQPHLGQQQQGVDGQDDQQAPVAQGEGNGTIPPAEVSKSIPCKFFPNCRYGAQCAFQHPVQPPPHQAFSPPPMHMYGYDQGPSPYPPAFYPMGPPFGYSSPPPPPGAMGMGAPPPPPPMHSVSPPPPPHQGAYPPPPPATTVDYSNDAAFIVNPQNQGMPPFMPSAMAPPFAPAFQPQSAGAAPVAAAAAAVESDAPQAEAAAAAVAPAPAAAAQKAEEAAPAQAAQSQAQQQQQAAPNAQQQQHGKGFPRKFGPFGAFPGKKFGPKSGAKWVGGNAPPCSFFLNNNCRNGDMCRFPHLNAEGVDCRNPGVIDGTIPSAPISVLPGKPARAPYAAGNFPLSSKAMQNSAASKVASRANADAASASAAETPAAGSTDGANAAAAAETHVPSAASPAFVLGRLNPNGPASARPFAQARAQPGSRPLSPGDQAAAAASRSNLRSLSAAPAAAGAGAAARRKDDNGASSVKESAAPSAAQLARQRVPSSDDFPALGGSVGSLKESTSSLSGSVVVVPAGAGKTAAQVLSTPAPAGTNPSYVKPAPPAKKAAAAPVKAADDEAKERQASKSSDDGQSSSSGKTSDSDDAVLVDAAKTAPSAPNGAPSPMPAAVKKIPSFAAATMVGAIKA